MMVMTDASPHSATRCPLHAAAALQCGLPRTENEILHDASHNQFLPPPRAPRKPTGPRRPRCPGAPLRPFLPGLPRLGVMKGRHKQRAIKTQSAPGMPGNPRGPVVPLRPNAPAVYQQHASEEFIIIATAIKTMQVTVTVTWWTGLAFRTGNCRFGATGAAEADGSSTTTLSRGSVEATSAGVA